MVGLSVHVYSTINHLLLEHQDTYTIVLPLLVRWLFALPCEQTFYSSDFIKRVFSWFKNDRHLLHKDIIKSKP